MNKEDANEQEQPFWDEPVETTRGRIQEIYYDAYVSGIASVLASFGHAPKHVAHNVAIQILEAARGNPQSGMVTHTAQAVLDRLRGENLDVDYIGDEVTIIVDPTNPRAINPN